MGGCQTETPRAVCLAAGVEVGGKRERERERDRLSATLCLLSHQEEQRGWMDGGEKQGETTQKKAKLH